MSTPPDAESAVRRYLEFLVDPSSAVDHAAIESIESALAATSDPIEKLRLYTRLERARGADGEAVKLGFIMAAKGWADDQGVSLGAFQQIGVPDDVLVAAGYVVPGRSRPPRRGAPARQPPGPGGPA